MCVSVTPIFWTLLRPVSEALACARRRRLLILSGGSLVGKNLVQSLSQRRTGLELTGTNSMAQVPDNFAYDQVYLVPETQSPDFETRFVEILQAVEPELVIPCRDDDVLFLARWQAQQPEPQRYLCGPLSLAEAMLDKWLTFVLCQQHDLPCVPSALATDAEGVQALVQDFGFPLLFKPRQGFASREIQLCWQAEALAALPVQADFLIQPFMGQSQRRQSFLAQMQQGLTPLFYSFEAQKYSLQLLFGPESEPLARWVTLHHMQGGHSLDISVCHDPVLETLAKRCQQLFSELGWRGPLNIQCQQDDAGHYWIHELNGRFTGATSARCLLGLDEVGMTLQAFLDPDFPLLPPQTTRVLRQSHSVYVPQEAQHILENQGYWYAEH